MIIRRFDLQLKSVSLETRVRSYHSFEVQLYYCPDQYGNGCLLRLRNDDDSGCDYNLDVRYDLDFHKEDPVPYIWKYVNSLWSGENGSNKLVEFDICEMEL